MTFGAEKKKKNHRFTEMPTLIKNIYKYILVVLLFAACSKGGTTTEDNGGGGPHVDTPNDVTPPVIVINTPVDDQVFVSGSSISITGKLTDDYGLYRGSIRIVNNATGAVLKEQLYEIHGFLLYNFSLAYTTVVTTPSTYTVTVSFEDHGNNVTTKSVKVKVNP